MISEQDKESEQQVNGVIQQQYPEGNLSGGIVGWHGQEDCDNPRNFPSAKKLRLLGLISFTSFLSSLASSITAPGVSLVDAQFDNHSRILASFGVSIYVLGLALGPLLLAPLSEIYGRRIIITLASAFFSIWQIGCALAPNLGGLIAFRILAGIGGSGCLTIGGGVIADLYSVEERGTANAIFTIGPLFGPVLGPIFGGIIAQRAGWQWVFWVLTALGGATTAAVAVLYRETNPAVILRWKAQELGKPLDRQDLRLRRAPETGHKSASPDTWQLIRTGILRPMTFLIKSPIVSLLAVYMSFVFGLLYLLLTTITEVFSENYGWSIEICGLANLGLGVGFAIGLLVVARTSDATVIRLTAANQNVYQPEMRLATCIMFAFFVPISFFWYGWSTDKQTHWIVPIIGMVPFGFAMMGIFAPIQTYIIDIGGEYAASVLAGLTTTRCVFATFLPLAAPSMYASMGLGWGNSLLGFIGLALIPGPMLIYKYGAKLRERYPLRVN